MQSNSRQSDDYVMQMHRLARYACPSTLSNPCPCPRYGIGQSFRSFFLFFPQGTPPLFFSFQPPSEYTHTFLHTEFCLRRFSFRDALVQ